MDQEAAQALRERLVASSGKRSEARILAELQARREQPGHAQAA